MDRRTVTRIVCVAALALAVSLTMGCSGGGGSYGGGTPPAAPPAAPPATPPSGGTGGGTPAAGGSAVTIQDFQFSPATLTVTKGTTVTWTNQGSASHTVTSDTNVWPKSDVSPGATFSYKFTTAGTFPYHCSIHPSMTAQIVVK
jgi:plastocyanin